MDNHEERLRVIFKAICHCANNGINSYYALIKFEPYFNDYYDIVLNAVKENGLALKFASTRLRANYEIVYEAIKNNRLAYDFADVELAKDHRIRQLMGFFCGKIEFIIIRIIDAY